MCVVLAVCGFFCHIYQCKEQRSRVVCPHCPRAVNYGDYCLAACVCACVCFHLALMRSLSRRSIDIQRCFSVFCSICYRRRRRRRLKFDVARPSHTVLLKRIECVYTPQCVDVCDISTSSTLSHTTQNRSECELLSI